MIVMGKKAQGQADEFNRWKDRMDKYQEWIQSHHLKEVKPGDKIDACDTEYIWCKATVELVIKTANHKDLLYIHYEGWNRKYDEYIYIDSHRLAPLGIYTGRQDIPVYRMMSNNGASGNGMQMMYAVVLSNAAEEARLVEYERQVAARQNNR